MSEEGLRLITLQISYPTDDMQAIMDREFLQYWFKDFKKLNTNDLENRRMLVNTFVNSVILYDNRIDFCFNYKDNVKTLKLSEIESLSDLASPTPPKVPLAWLR